MYAYNVYIYIYQLHQFTPHFFFGYQSLHLFQGLLCVSTEGPSASGVLPSSQGLQVICSKSTKDAAFQQTLEVNLPVISGNHRLNCIGHFWT